MIEVIILVKRGSILVNYVSYRLEIFFLLRRMDWEIFIEVEIFKISVSYIVTFVVDVDVAIDSIHNNYVIIGNFGIAYVDKIHEKNIWIYLRLVVRAIFGIGNRDVLNRSPKLADVVALVISICIHVMDDIYIC